MADAAIRARMSASSARLGNRVLMSFLLSEAPFGTAGRYARTPEPAPRARARPPPLERYVRRRRAVGGEDDIAIDPRPPRSAVGLVIVVGDLATDRGEPRDVVRRLALVRLFVLSAWVGAAQVVEVRQH